MNDFLKNIISKNSFAVILAVAGVAATLFNLYLTSKLYPLADSINGITARVQAVELRQDRQGIFVSTLATKTEMQAGFDSVNKRLDDLRAVILSR